MPRYLTCDWVLSQFGAQRAAAHKRYRVFVAEGVKAPSPWERLEAQIILGNEAFVSTFKRPGRRLIEVRREQRFLGRPALERLLTEKLVADRGQRDRAIVKAALRHGYTQAAIAKHLGLHYSLVSKLIKRETSHDSRFKT